MTRDRSHGATVLLLVLAALAASINGSWAADDADQGDGLSIRITRPTPDMAAVGPTLVQVQIQTPPGRKVVRVILSVDGHLIGDLSRPPWQAMFDAGETLHPHTLRAEVHDDSGAHATDLSTTLYISYVEEVEVVGARATRYAIQAAVLDGHRTPIRNLTPDLFTFHLRGESETLISAALDERPLSVEILLDVSGTTLTYWPQIREAANRFISLLEEEDGSETMIFAGDVGRLVGFTHDHAAARKKILTMQDTLNYPDFNPYGTHLYDALAAGIEEINVRPGQRSLVVLTDSLDMGSTISYKLIERVVRQAGLRLDVVRFGRRPASGWSEATRMMKQLRNLAQASGGMEWPVYYSDEIPGVFGKLARQLKSRYRLVIAPDLTAPEQGRTLPLKVKVARRNVKVLAPATLFTSPEKTTEVPPPPQP
jgi:hypothetical protein